MSALRLYFLQRITAIVMVPFVLVHLIVMVIAIHGGLSAEEILSRTRGNMAWALFYALFVVSAAIHGSLGLRNILRDMTRLPETLIDKGALLSGLFLLVMGFYAVAGVFWGGHL